MLRILKIMNWKQHHWYERLHTNAHFRMHTRIHMYQNTSLSKTIEKKVVNIHNKNELKIIKKNINTFSYKNMLCVPSFMQMLVLARHKSKRSINWGVWVVVDRQLWCILMLRGDALGHTCGPEMGSLMVVQGSCGRTGGMEHRTRSQQLGNVPTNLNGVFFVSRRRFRCVRVRLGSQCAMALTQSCCFLSLSLFVELFSHFCRSVFRWLCFSFSLPLSALRYSGDVKSICCHISHSSRFFCFLGRVTTQIAKANHSKLCKTSTCD